MDVNQNYNVFLGTYNDPMLSVHFGDLANKTIKLYNIGSVHLSICARLYEKHPNPILW